MNKSLILSSLLLLSIFSCAEKEPVKVQQTPESLKIKAGTALEMSKLVSANNEFALSIFKQMASGDNLFISPFSISSAMSMIYAGSGANTEAELSSTLKWPENSLEFHKAFGALNKKLSKSKAKDFTFNIANRLYTDLDVELYTEFSAINKDQYGASVQSIDFSKTEEATKTINAWVSEKTEKMIPELLKPSVLGSVKLVLVNAIYFYGGWAMPFEEKNTIKEFFYENPENKIETDFMKKYWSKDDSEVRFGYTQNDRFQVLDLPYSENKGSMVILLPQKDSLGNFQPLNELLKSLSYQELDSLLNGLNPISSRLDLKMPKWKQKSNADLVDVFKSLGMSESFMPNADFSKISPNVRLSISAIIHEAVVEVSEKGTKAAASTAIMTKETAAYQDPDENVVFHADHPFIYLIRDKSTGSILFIGQMLKP